MNLREKKVLIYDRGKFFHIAQRLARDFGRVYYYLAEEDPEPNRALDEIGMGFDNIEVAYDFWKYVDKVDIIVFPHVYNGGLPIWLKAHGYKVVSALKSEQLEVDKLLLKKILKIAKLPVIPFVVKQGLDEIEKYLHDKSDKWLKASHYRGDLETHHHANSFLSTAWFDSMRNKLGTAGDNFELLIEDAIESDCEAGFDSPMLNGELARYPMIGYENKDIAYASKVVDVLPPYLAKVHERLQPIFKSYGYQSWYSSELKIAKDKKPYYLDATCRFGCPPSGISTENYKNFSEILWDLAHEKMPKPIPLYKYGVEIIVSSYCGINSTLPIEFPPELEQWVKLKDAKRIAPGKFHIVPHKNNGYFGTVVALGNDLESTITTVLDRVAMLKGEDIEYDKHGFDAIYKSIEAGKKYGIKF